MIFSVSNCKLHGFANIWEEIPPSGLFSVTSKANPDLVVLKSLGNSARNKELVQLPKAIMLHWQPSNLERWIIEVLPKLEFLMQNDWFGEEDAKLLLPYTNLVVQYLQLAEIEIEKRVIWIRANEVYAVKELTFLDFKSETPNSKYVIPSPGLLSDLRFRYTEEPYDLEGLDVILLLRSDTERPGMDKLSDVLSNAVGDVNNALGTTYQFIDLDTHAAIHRVIHAYKRARVVIGPGSEELANVVWMSKGSTLVEIPNLPTQQTKAAVLAAQLGVNYWVVPELGQPSQAFLPVQISDETVEYFKNLLERVLA